MFAEVAESAQKKFRGGGGTAHVPVRRGMHAILTGSTNNHLFLLIGDDWLSDDERSLGAMTCMMSANQNIR